MSTTESKAVARKAPSPLAQWKAELYHEQTITNLAKALQGTGYSAERFAFTAYMAASRSPKLLTNKTQLWLGVYAAAECGLSLQPHVQQMHLVPFGGEVTPIIGYQGFTYLASKAGGGLMSPPVYVFQRDVDEKRFRYRKGTSGRGSSGVCELDPVVRDPRTPKGMLRYVFATYTSPSGVVMFECLDRDEILGRRERSAGWQAFKNGRRKTSPWNIEVLPDGTEHGDWIAMAGKTVLRVLGKYTPKSTDHWGERAAKAEAVEGSVDGEAGVEGLKEVLDTTFTLEQEKTGTETLKEKLGVEDAQVEEPPEEAFEEQRRIRKERGE